MTVPPPGHDLPDPRRWRPAVGAAQVAVPVRLRARRRLLRVPDQLLPAGGRGGREQQDARGHQGELVSR